MLVDNRMIDTQNVPNKDNRSTDVDIYVAQHCAICAYAHEVAENIRHQFPHVQVRIIDMATTSEAIPEVVFATPTYLLNGKVWSLGNPSPAKLQETFAVTNED